MLYYSPQIWCSDNTDATSRMKIQYGTSLAYPTRCVGAHVTEVPNPVTCNSTRLRTRAFMAMCGTFGFELDLTRASDKDLAAFKTQVDVYKQVHPVVRWGDLYRLWNPFKVMTLQHCAECSLNDFQPRVYVQLSFGAWMYVLQDKSQAVVFAFALNSDHWSNLVPRLQLQGLNPDYEYEITEPLPNNINQAHGVMVESDGKSTSLQTCCALYSGFCLSVCYEHMVSPIATCAV
jgi:alpha-galactosidase